MEHGLWFKLLENSPVAVALLALVRLFLGAMDRRDANFLACLAKRDERIEAGFDRLAESVAMMRGVVDSCGKRGGG